MKKLRLIAPFILLLIALIPLFWYRPDSIISGGDMGLPLDYKFQLEKGISTWDNSVKTGKNNVLGLSGLPEYYFFKIINLIDLPANKIEIIYFSLLLLGTLFSFYFFAKQIVREYSQEENNLVPLIGSIFYFFNFFTITRWEGFDRPIIYQMIGIPLMLGLLIKNLRKERPINYFFLGIASIIFCYSVINPPSFLAGVLTVLLFCLYLLFNSLWNKDFVRFRKIVLIGLKSLVVIIVCNLFWLVPVLNLGSPKSVFEEVAPLDWLEGISQSCSFKNVIRLMGAWYWYDSNGEMPYAPYAQIYQLNPFFIVLTYLVPLFCLIGLLFSRKKKETYFIIPILLAGLILSMGENGPFGKIYRFVYEHIIIFRVFRSPWFKFSLLTIFAYSFYYGLFSAGIFVEIKNRWPKMRYWLLPLFLSFPIILSHPLIKAPYYKNFRVKVPDYVINAVKYFDGNLKDGQRLYLYSFDQNDGYTWGYAAILPVLYRLSKWPTLGPWYSILRNHLSDQLVGSVDLRLKTGNREGITNYLSYLGVKYLILRKDILSLEETKKNYIENQIKKQTNITFEKSFSDWDIYENKDPRPLFVLNNKLINIPDNEMLLKIIGSENINNSYCLNCDYQLGVVNRYNITPGDFKKREGGFRDYEFETIEDNEYIFSVKINGDFRINPAIYLDGNLLKLEPSKEQSVYIGRKVIYPGKHIVRLNESIFQGKNFIKNGDFSKSLDGWEFFDEGTYYGLPIKSSLEKFGTGRVKLASINKSAVMSQKVNGLKKNGKYRLRFSFKSLGMLPLQVGISTQQVEAMKFIVDPEDQKFYSKKEVTREIIFESDFPSVFVNFYTKVLSKEPNLQVISNVSLYEVGSIESINVIPVVTKSKNDLQFLKESSTSYVVNFSTNMPAWLVYNNTCDNGWKAFDSGEELKHLCVNGFANGYFISQVGKHKIELSYSPEQTFKRMLKVSKIFLLVLFLFALMDELLRFIRKPSLK